MPQQEGTNEQEHKITCFARWIWPRRNETAPNKEQVGEVRKHVTWAEVFKLRTGHTLDSWRLRVKGLPNNQAARQGSLLPE